MKERQGDRRGPRDRRERFRWLAIFDSRKIVERRSGFDQRQLTAGLNYGQAVKDQPPVGGK